MTGGRNRKIWRFLGSVWESFHLHAEETSFIHSHSDKHTHAFTYCPSFESGDPRELQTHVDTNITRNCQAWQKSQPGIHIQTGQQIITHDIKGSCLMTHTRDPERGQDPRLRLRDCEPALKTSDHVLNGHQSKLALNEAHDAHCAEKRKDDGWRKDNQHNQIWDTCREK